VSCIETFKATWESHIPVKPPTTKTTIYAIQKYNSKLTFKAPLNKESVQFTIFIVAGKDIITVIVLYKDLLL
jgi:hypothetical protein|tara:strand:+ start:767 stop:982 length:216 start_codon:yes stop_codon:yes gene_type:complete